MRFNNNLRLPLAAACALGIGACSSSSDPAATTTGTLSLSLMDRPVDDVTELWVTISEISIKPNGSGPAFQLPMTTTPLKVNLLELNDQTASLMVDEAVIDAGSYNWIELEIEDADINDSYAMTTTGGMMPVDVDVPSGKIRLVSGFDVGANQAVRLLFDWDVRSGLTEAVGRGVYLLRPAFRMLNVDEYGTISGTITQTTLGAEASCTGAADPNIGKVVYIFDGTVTPDDIDGIDPDPVTTVDAEFNVSTGDWDYRAVVMPGDYTVAFTCEGDLDTDTGDEAITFIDPAAGPQVAVTDGESVDDVDF